MSILNKKPHFRAVKTKHLQLSRIECYKLIVFLHETYAFRLLHDLWNALTLTKMLTKVNIFVSVSICEKDLRGNYLYFLVTFTLGPIEVVR